MYGERPNRFGNEGTGGSGWAQLRRFLLIVVDDDRFVAIVVDSNSFRSACFGGRHVLVFVGVVVLVGVASVVSVVVAASVASLGAVIFKN